MKKSLFITGTDTGIGKSVITAGLAGTLVAHGIDVGVMKPLQSGGKMVNGKLISEDAYFAQLAAHLTDSLEEINPVCLTAPLAPALAAEREKQVLSLEILTLAYQNLLAKHDFLLVEGAGGLCVPYLQRNYLVADLVKHWQLPLLIVARAGLGTINHTVLTVEYAQQKGINVVGVILNGAVAYQEAEDNACLINQLTGIKVWGILPQIADLSVEQATVSCLLKEIEKNISLDYWLGGKENEK